MDINRDLVSNKKLFLKKKNESYLFDFDRILGANSTRNKKQLE